MTRPAKPSITVTGAAGYIGPHVVRAIAELGYEPVAVVRPGKTLPTGFDRRARVVEADVLDPHLDLSRVIGPETVGFVHLAWQDGFIHNAPSHIDLLPVHHRLLTGVAAAGIPRIAGLGTMHEVGYWEGAIDADTPTSPTSLYGIAKDALRRSTTLVIGDSAEYVWLRCYYIVGDDRRSRSIFSKLIEAADRGDTEFPFTSGRNRYDFIDVARLGQQIAVAATTAGVTGILNCSSGKPVSLGERVERFIHDKRLPIALRYGAFPDRPYDSPGVWGDATQIRQLMRESSFAWAADFDPDGVGID